MRLADLPWPHYALRAEFMLRPDVTFLNHGSFGACPRPVFETYQAWQRELEAQPVEFLGRRYPGLITEARRPVAAYVGADPQDIVFVPNATYGLNAIARALRLQPGDEVLTSDHEYGAMDRTWRFMCARQGARYVRVPLPVPFGDAQEVVERIWAGVTERTRVLFLSHITSPTALILPVAALCARARAAGILTVIDGAHGPSQLDLDMAALGADFYVGNCHKWLCSPKSAAFLYARPAVQPLLEPLVVSWGWERDPPGDSPFLDWFEWSGTADPAAVLSVPAAIAYQQERGWEQVRADCRRLLAALAQAWHERTGLPLLSDPEAGWWSQMVSLPLPNDERITQAKLYEGFGVEAPLVVWNGLRLLRVSCQGHNAPEDMVRLMAAVDELLTL